MIYDKESEERIQDAADVPKPLAFALAAQGVQDASETVLFARQLETVSNRIYEKKYAELKGRRFVPFSNEGGPNSEYFTVRVWDGTVMAKLITDYATDFPLVSMSAQEHTMRYHDVGLAYGFSIRELRIAAATGVALETRKAELARRGIEQAIDEAVAVGVPAIRTFGLINHPNASLFSLPNGTWSSATGEQILADLNAILTQNLVSTLEILSIDTILMSTAAYRKIATTMVNSSAGALTVLEAFRNQNPGVTVESWTRLSNANAAGTNGRIVAYRRDPEVMQFQIGSEFEVFPATMQGTSIVYPTMARFAGLALHHPLALMYCDNQLI